MLAIKQKDDSINPIIIVVILINLFFLGNTFFSGWSLLWPTAPGVVTSADPKIFYAVGKYGNSARYSLVLTYTYQYESVPPTPSSRKKLFAVEIW